MLRFLRFKSSYKRKTTTADTDACSLDTVTGHKILDLPDLPPRYASLDFPRDMPGECYRFWASSFQVYEQTI